MLGARRNERSTVSAAKEGTSESHDEGIVLLLFFLFIFFSSVEGGGGREIGRAHV